MADLQYKPIFAQQVWDRMRCDDTPLYFKDQDGTYKLVDYFWTGIDGDCMVCGMFDVGIEDDEYYHRVDPYTYLYLVDQDTCPHVTEQITENAGIVEHVCNTCGKRAPAKSPEPETVLNSHPQFSEMIRRLSPEARAAFKLWEAESIEYARFCKAKAPDLANWDEIKAILQQAGEMLQRTETARLAYFNLLGMS